MMWSQRYHPRVTHLLSAPCDVPYLPPDIANRLKADLIARGASIAVARDDGGLHPTIGLWPVSLASNLANDLVGRGMHGMQAWIRQFSIAQTDLNSHHLQNINTPEDLNTAHVEPRFQGDRV
jgi:molybdopterin-guanine dinucleotide biosynthesis protein A